MAVVRIFVMYPAGEKRKTWHVCPEGNDGETFTDGLQALGAAFSRARFLERRGYEVQVRQEDADGIWHVVNE